MYRLLIFVLLVSATLSVLSQTYQEQLKAIHSNVVEEKDGKSYFIHTVKKGQTLYMISKSYGVEVNDIIAENPEVKEGLKSDMKLYIPNHSQKKVELAGKPESGNESSKTITPPPVTPPPSSEKSPPPSGTATPPATSLQNPPKTSSHPVSGTQQPQVMPCGSDTTSMRKNYKVVLILPLYLEEVEAMDPEKATEDDVNNWNSIKFLPFYEGFTLAVDSLQNQGLHLTLYVYDLGKDSVKAQQLIKKEELKSADLIIGLLFNKNFQIISKFAHDNKIPIVNPISERADILRDNEYVFKVNPSRASQLESLASYMQKNMSRAQITIIRNGQFKDKDIADKLKKQCEDRKLDVTLAEGQDVAIGKLSKTRENVIVAFTDNNVYALDLMRRFYELRNDYNISLIGLPEWEKIEGLETDFLNGLNTHMVSPYFIDYTSSGVKKLVSRYNENYKSDPEPLAFLGFDVGYYFLYALMKYGKQFPKCIDFRLETSETSFEFVKSGNIPGNGFENRHWSVYKYENFKLLKVN